MKKLTIFSLIFLLSGIIFAQVSVNPNDKFYIEAQGWHLKGYVDDLPMLRPYPVNTIRHILLSVIQKGSEYESSIALSEYERIFGKPYNVSAGSDATFKISQMQDDEKKRSFDKNLSAQLSLAGDFSLHPLVSVGYQLGFYAETNEFKNYAKYAENKLVDSIFDPADIGPFDSYLNCNTNVSYGTSAVYVSAGLSRVGFGPFYGDGLALNETAYHSANIVFNATTEKWSYASVYQSIGASNNLGENSGDWISDGKYLAFHAVKYNFNKFVSLSYYENVVFGPRMNIAYLFPAPYMAIQNIGGANDNLQMGLLLEVKPLPNLNWATDIFVDDFEVNKVVKLKFNSKIRIAAQTGFVFTPVDSPCKRVSLNYTAVMPYTYAHWEYEDSNTGIISGSGWNYQNYTNAGVHIGSSLDPNSDKISINARFSPRKNIQIDVSSSFIRHANSAEDFSEDEAATYTIHPSGTYRTDGSVFMHQMFTGTSWVAHGDHVGSAWDKLGFMTSDHTMYVCQAGALAEIEMPKTKLGQLTLKLGYSFEYIRNAGVDRDIYKGYGFVYNGGTSFTYRGVNFDNYWAMLYAARTDAAVAKQMWVDQLYDAVHNYITVGIKYSF